MKYFFNQTCAQPLVEIERKKFDLLCQQRVTFVCVDVALHYFIEYIQSLEICTFILLYTANEREHCAQSIVNWPSDAAFLCANDMELCVQPLPNFVVFASEQMTIDSRRQSFVDYLHNSGKLLHYSLTNFNLLQTHMDNLATGRPKMANNRQLIVKYNKNCHAEQNQLQSLLRNTPKAYDCAFVGSLTERRKTIINKLQQRFSVHIVQCFGALRDAEIAKCHLLLNLHATDQFGVYESLRCERWRQAGLQIVSEDSIDESRPTDNIAFVPTVVTSDKTNNVNLQKLVDAIQTCLSLTANKKANCLPISMHRQSVQTQLLQKLTSFFEIENLHFSLDSFNWSHKLTARYGVGQTKDSYRDVTAAFLLQFATFVQTNDTEDGKSGLRLTHLYVPKSVSFNSVFGDVCPFHVKTLCIELEDDLCKFELSEQRKCDLKLNFSNED